VTDLRHRETAHQLCCPGICQVFLVVVVGAKPLNASREQADLDAELYDEIDIVKCERFKRSNKFGKILFTTNETWHNDSTDARVGQPLGPSQDLSSLYRHVISVVIPKLRLNDELLDPISDFSIFAVQQALQRRGLERRSSSFDRRISLSSDHLLACLNDRQRLLEHLFHLRPLRLVFRIAGQKQIFFADKNFPR
jgi:hypothetical protein